MSFQLFSLSFAILNTFFCPLVVSASAYSWAIVGPCSCPDYLYHFLASSVNWYLRCGSANFHHFVLGYLDGFLSAALLLTSVHTCGICLVIPNGHWDVTDYLENQSRRNNLRIDGVKERGGETWEMTEEALRRTFEHGLKMPTEQVRSLAIERAHRTGGKTDRDRTIVVKFASFKARDAILQAARAAKPRGVYVNEDFSMRVVNRRKELIPEMRAARDIGKIAYLSFDKLVVKDRLERCWKHSLTTYISSLVTNVLFNFCFYLIMTMLFLTCLLFSSAYIL